MLRRLRIDDMVMTCVYSAAIRVAALLFLSYVTVAAGQAQTYKILYAFADGADGAYPWAGLTMDRAGNLYGTANNGGRLTGSCAPYGCGTVFRLSPTSSGWAFSNLHSFGGGTDGQSPNAGVIFGTDGSLYGSTAGGGVVWPSLHAAAYTGTIYKLSPPSDCSTVSCYWTKSILYKFMGGSDGGLPGVGNLVFDAAGNLYGVTVHGGNLGGDCSNTGCGTVFELMPSQTGWTEQVLHAFSVDENGYSPDFGLIFDQSGNLYGETSSCGGPNCYGLAYELSPGASGWTETVLHRFGETGGSYPAGGLVFDPAGNLYGVTCCFGGGDAFELTPSANGWTVNVLYGFNGSYGPVGAAGLVRDAAGNLYGTTNGDGACGFGNVFKLTPSLGGWIYTDLHDFCRSDGAEPTAPVLLDSEGNLYGTTTQGGDTSACYVVGCGVVWEITP